MPWLSLAILFPIVASFGIPLLPNKAVKWYGLGTTLTTFLITVLGYLKGYDPTVSTLQLVDRVSWIPESGSFMVCGGRRFINATHPPNKFHYKSCSTCCITSHIQTKTVLFSTPSDGRWTDYGFRSAGSHSVLPFMGTRTDPCLSDDRHLGW